MQLKMPSANVNHLASASFKQWLLFLKRNPRNTSQWNFKQNWNSLKHENAFENVVCKMAAILSKPQCIHRDIEECVERRHRFPNPDVWFFGASRLRHLLTRFMSLYTGKILNLHDLVSDAKWHSFPLGVKPIKLVSIEPISWNIGILNIELPWRQFCTHWWHFRLSLTTKFVLGKLFVCLFVYFLLLVIYSAFSGPFY